jgi:hypothetical protein
MEKALAKLGWDNNSYLGRDGNPFGGWAFAEGWFIKRKLIGNDSFRATDVCWIYPKKTTRKTSIGLVIDDSWTIILRLKSGREVELYLGLVVKPHGLTTRADNNPAPSNLADLLQVLQRTLPWAISLYSPELEECWKKNRALFTEVITRRMNAIMVGLQRGQLVIRPDGGITTTIQDFSYPIISMRVEGTGRKTHRIYEIGSTIIS